jgi:hypothetical protein
MGTDESGRGGKTLGRQVPHLLFHFEAVKEGSVAAHVNILTQGTTASLPAWRHRTGTRSRYRLPRLKSDPIQGTFQGGAAAEKMFAGFPPAPVKQTQGNRSLGRKPLAEDGQFRGQGFDVLRHQHHIDGSPAAEPGQLLQTGQGCLETTRSGQGIAQIRLRPRQADPHLCPSVNQAGCFPGPIRVHQGRPVGEDVQVQSEGHNF